MNLRETPRTTGPRRLPEEDSVSGSQPRSSVVQHLEELRSRILVGLAALLVGMGASFAWTERIIAWLKVPAGDLLPKLIFLSPAEALVAYLKVTALSGLVLAMPVWLYEVWAFVRPGLSRQERGYAAGFILLGTLSFAAGMVFAYRLLLPVSLRFLLSFASDTLTPAITIGRYLGFTTAVLLACGFVFELPLAAFFLTRLGILTPAFLIHHWRMALLAMTVAAGILTPTPDVVNMLLLLGPLLALYGLSVAVSWLAAPRRKRTL